MAIDHIPTVGNIIIQVGRNSDIKPGRISEIFL